MVMKLNMVDLKGQYNKIREEVNVEIQKVLDTTAFINGPKVKEFAFHLAEYNRVKHVIPCGNGTDALQIALMALGLKPGDNHLIPRFYIRGYCGGDRFARVYSGYGRCGLYFFQRYR